MIYTGVGSRKVPNHVCDVLTVIAQSLNGWTLRSGAAIGCDAAFERGSTLKEIYLPHEGFNNHNGIDATTLPMYSEAMDIAKHIHPIWRRCSLQAKKLHTRNVFQVLGADLMTPSDMLICWTVDGANGTSKPTSIMTGGTATAINLAVRNDVPVFNVANDDELYSMLNITGIYSMDELLLRITA